MQRFWLVTLLACGLFLGAVGPQAAWARLSHPVAVEDLALSDLFSEAFILRMVGSHSFDPSFGTSSHNGVFHLRLYAEPGVRWDRLPTGQEQAQWQSLLKQRYPFLKALKVTSPGADNQFQLLELELAVEARPQVRFNTGQELAISLKPMATGQTLRFAQAPPTQSKPPQDLGAQNSTDPANEAELSLRALNPEASTLAEPTPQASNPQAKSIQAQAALAQLRAAVEAQQPKAEPANNPQAQSLYQLSRGTASGSKTETLLAKAWQAYQTGDLQQAQASVKELKASKTKGDSASTLASKGQAAYLEALLLLENNEAEAALALLSEAEPLTENARLLLAQLLVQQQAWPEAKLVLAQAQGSALWQTQRYLLLGTMAEAEGQLHEAEQAYQQALHHNEYHVLAHYRVARVAMQQQQWAKAQHELRWVLRWRPMDSDALQSLAYVKLKQGEPQQALALYRQSVPPQRLLAWAQLEQANQQPEQARQVLQAAQVLSQTAVTDPALQAQLEALRLEVQSAERSTVSAQAKVSAQADSTPRLNSPSLPRLEP